mmetsp:Transcript_37974/g.114780  ORF Transcript_37974/g.114780 Transcript_37974/m.114780 type:complete len:206 (+) Transcript_37974:495-1112(+)
MAMAWGFFLVPRLIATTSQPIFAANCTARPPKPPMETIKTLDMCVAYVQSGFQTVMPAHTRGAAPMMSRPSGMGMANFSGLTQNSANVPFIVVMAPTASLVIVEHTFSRAAWHWRQVVHAPRIQPRPTCCPTLRLLTAEPTSTILPMPSCPATMGYLDAPISLLAMARSVRQRPDTSISMSTSVGPHFGRGITSDAISKPSCFVT